MKYLTAAQVADELNRTGCFPITFDAKTVREDADELKPAPFLRRTPEQELGLEPVPLHCAYLPKPTSIAIAASNLWAQGELLWDADEVRAFAARHVAYHLIGAPTGEKH